MTPNEMMFLAQQYQAPQGMLQVPKLGLLSVPDMSASYTDMSASDEEIRKRLKLGPTDKITPEMRMQVAGERLKEIPGNIMSVPGNVMDAAGSFAEGILGLFGK